MTIQEIINKGRIFQVTGDNGKFAATIVKDNDKFIIQAGGNINFNFLIEEDAGDIFLDTMDNFVDKLGKITTPVTCNTLDEAAKCVCFDNHWDKVTYPDFSDKSIYQLINEPIEEIAKTEHSDYKEPKESKNPARILGELLGDALEKLSEPKPVDLSDKTLDKIEALMPKQAEVIEDIEDDFDWGEDESEVTKDDLVGIDFDKIDAALRTGKGAVIIEGVPGTGKTKAMMAYLADKAKNGAYVEKVTFHQEYTYQEFIGGVTSVNGVFKYVPGIFTELCHKAYKNPGVEHYLGIDEFSRGNPEAIMGEVMTAICAKGSIITLSSGRKIKVPKNLFIIASMNVTDNSTKNIDLATYQRFIPIRIDPQWTTEYMLKVSKGDTQVYELLIQILDDMVKLNKSIKADGALGKDKVIGTRAITIENPNLESMIEAILGDLCKTIERTTHLCYGDTKTLSNDTLKHIEKVCNDARKQTTTE